MRGGARIAAGAMALRKLMLHSGSFRLDSAMMASPPKYRLQIHTATTSIAGSMVRTRFSIAISVPDCELGQLPHVP